MHLLMVAQVAAEATKAVLSPTNGDVSEVVPYLTGGAMIMYVQRFLKGRAVYQAFVKAFPGADKWAHWMIAAIGAFITALGIHWTFSGDYTAGWEIHIGIPNAWALLHAFGDWGKVFILQQLTYDMTSRTPGAVAAIRSHS